MNIGRAKTLLMGVTMLLAVVLPASSLHAKEMKQGAMKKGETMTFLDVPLKTILGDSTSLSKYKGDVMLVVNVASKCGFTPQYEALEALYRKYKEQGFVVIGFPSNDFRQEPGTDKEILDFCRQTYNVNFPMMSKTHVKGDSISPVYAYLTEKSPYPGEITWNFNKFLIDRNGHVVARYDTRTKPDSKQIVSEIEKQLMMKPSE